MSLKKYRIVKCEPKGKIAYSDKTYDLETLTDDQAEELVKRGSIYIEKIESRKPENSSSEKSDKTKSDKSQNSTLN